MKVSWGVGISLTIIIFTIVSLGFIYFAFNQDVNLVRDDYYEAESNFDKKFDGITRSNELSERILTKIMEDNLIISFPKQFMDEEITGTILLYRPSQKNLDKSFDISLDSTNNQSIAIKALQKGQWKIQIDWNVDTLNYFTEQIIMVQ